MKTSRKSNLVRCAVLFLAGGLWAPSGWGQFSSSIEGTVTDAWYRDTPGENPELLGMSWRKSASRYQLLTRASRGGSHCAAEICG